MVRTNLDKLSSRHRQPRFLEWNKHIISAISKQNGTNLLAPKY